MNPQLKMGGRSIPLPASRIARIVIGSLLILFGMFGFLPILGFWMIPVGLLVLSVDLPRVRRWRRRFFVWWERKRRGPNGNGTRRAADEAGGEGTPPSTNPHLGE